MPSEATKNSPTELEIDIKQLTPRGRAIYQAILEPIGDGFRETEIAAKLGRTASWVSERLSEVRQEVYRQLGVFPPMSDQEFASLKDSIRTHGIRMPVLLDEELNIIDGRHRVKAAVELGVPCPYLIVGGLEPWEKEELEVALNAARRHLSRAQKRKLVEIELNRDPYRSDRRVAAVCGVSHPTVADVRRELRAAREAWLAEGLPPREAPADPSLFDGVDDEVALNVGAQQASLLFSEDRGPRGEDASEMGRVPDTQEGMSEGREPIAYPAPPIPIDPDPPERVAADGSRRLRRPRVAIPRARMVCALPAPCGIAVGERVEVWKVGGEYELRTA